VKAVLSGNREELSIWLIPETDQEINYLESFEQGFCRSLNCYIHPKKTTVIFTREKLGRL